MRVALSTNLYPPIQTGSSIWTQELARHLAAAGDEVVVITCGSGSSTEVEECDGVTVYRLPRIGRLPTSRLFFNASNFYLMNSASNRAEAVRICRRHSVELIHQCGQLLDSVLISSAVSRETGIPAVCSIHTKIGHTARAFDLLLSSVDRWVMGNVVLRRFQTLIALDQVLARYVEERYRPDRVRVLPVCVRSCLVKGPAAHHPERHGPIRAVSLGHVTEMRDRVDLLRAIAAVRRVGVDLRLTVVGKLMTDRPRAVLEELGLLDAVDFTGEILHEEALQLLRDADFEVHWITMPGIGSAGVEAMALGLPIVTYAPEDLYPGVPLADRKNLLLIDPAQPATIEQALHWLCADRGRRIAVGAAARSVVARHLTWDSVLPQVQQIYAEAAA